MYLKNLGASKASWEREILAVAPLTAKWSHSTLYHATFIMISNTIFLFWQLATNFLCMIVTVINNTDSLPPIHMLQVTRQLKMTSQFLSYLLSYLFLPNRPLPFFCFFWIGRVSSASSSFSVITAGRLLLKGHTNINYSKSKNYNVQQA